MAINLSNRLTACLKAVSPYQTLADVGTDHGYLPCAGILSQQLTKAIAADIGVGPLTAAKHQISRYGLTEQIETRLGPGVSVLKPSEVEAVVIAGMGGKLIASILTDDVALTRSFKRLVLQPNIDADLVRRCTKEQGLHIVSEIIIHEDEKFYEIIVVEPKETKQQLSELDLLFGPYLRQAQSDVFKAKWQKEVNKNNEILNQLPAEHPRAVAILNRQLVLKDVLA